MPEYPIPAKIQEFMLTTQNLLLLAFLIFLEGILSIDNALVLALLAKNLPKKQQKKALSYGLWGAALFRLAALGIISQLIKWTWVKYVGGAYLIFIALKNLVSQFRRSRQSEPVPHLPETTGPLAFWTAVLVIELTDIAFAMDSILAAFALTSNFWLIFAGGFIGVILMRYAATLILQVLERFPAFERTAYLLVLVIGIKVILESLHLPEFDFQASSNAAFRIFWGVMLACILYGFKPQKIKLKSLESS